MAVRSRDRIPFFPYDPYCLHEFQTVEFAKLRLHALLERSFGNNARLKGTGIPLYQSGNFLQLIEGEAEAVDSLYEKIRHDPRHKNVMTFLREEIPGRQFDKWSMAFKDLSTDPACSEGFNRLLNQSTSDISRLPSKARAFIGMFTL